MQTLFPVQARLRLGPAGSEKAVESDRDTKLTRENSGQQSRLVETALSQPSDMKRDGKNHIYRLGACFLPDQPYQQFHQRRHPMELTAEF